MAKRTENDILRELAAKIRQKSDFADWTEDLETDEGILKGQMGRLAELQKTAKELHKSVGSTKEAAKNIEKSVDVEKKRIEQLKRDFKVNNRNKALLDKEVATSRTLRETSAAKSDDLSQKIATLSAEGKNLKIDDGGPLDRMVHDLAAGMATAVTSIRSLGLPAKEFTKKTLGVLGKYEKGIKSDAALNLKSSPNARKALRLILGVLEKHRAAVSEAGELSPLKLLGAAMAGGAKQGIANMVKAVPGMGTMDRLATTMGLKPVSERINEKLGGKKGSLDQELVGERGADDADVMGDVADTARDVLATRTNVDIGRASLDRAEEEDKFRAKRLAKGRGGDPDLQPVREDPAPILTRIADTLDGTKEQNQKIHENETAERAEVRQDAKEDAAKKSKPSKAKDESSDSPIPVPGGGEDDKPEGGGIIGAIGDVASTAAGTVMGTGAANVASGLASRVVGGGARSGVGAAAGNLAGSAGVRRFVPAKGSAAKGASSLLKGGKGMMAAMMPFGSGGIMSGIMTGLSSFGSALAGMASSIAAIALPILAVAAILYSAYEIFKRLDFSAILKPLAKYFNILKDIVMTVGTVIFKGLQVAGKVLMEIFYAVYKVFQKVFDVVAWVLQPLLDGLAFVLTPVVDMFGKLWEATKPLVKAVGDFFDTLLQADSIFLELGRILKDAFLGMVAKIWNALASTGLGKLAGMDKMEVPEKTVRPPAREDAPAPPPAAPPPAAPPSAPPPAAVGDAYAGLTIKGSSGQTQTGGGGQATGGGPVQPGVIDFASMIQGNVQGFTRFTGFNDNHHQASGSMHAKGLAMDFTVDSPSKAPAAARAVRKLAADAGVPPGGIDVIDEYNNPSSGATAGHIHAEFNTKEAAMVVAAGGLDSSPTFVPSLAGGRTRSMNAAAQTAGVPGVSRSGAGVAAATARHASQTAAAPTIVANIGGPPAPAAPSVTTMMPIPIPINARTEDMALRALQSANYSL